MPLGSYPSSPHLPASDSEEPLGHVGPYDDLFEAWRYVSLRISTFDFEAYIDQPPHTRGARGLKPLLEKPDINGRKLIARAKVYHSGHPPAWLLRAMKELQSAFDTMKEWGLQLTEAAAVGESETKAVLERAKHHAKELLEHVRREAAASRAAIHPPRPDSSPLESADLSELWTCGERAVAVVAVGPGGEHPAHMGLSSFARPQSDHLPNEAWAALVEAAEAAAQLQPDDFIVIQAGSDTLYFFDRSSPAVHFSLTLRAQAAKGDPAQRPGTLHIGVATGTVRYRENRPAGATGAAGKPMDRGSTARFISMRPV